MPQIDIGRFDNFLGADSLLIEADEAGLDLLINLAERLRPGEMLVSLSRIAGVVVHGRFEIEAELTTTDVGLVSVADKIWRWQRSVAGWRDVSEKLHAVRLGSAACHQYLDAPSNELQVVVAKGEYGASWWSHHVG